MHHRGQEVNAIQSVFEPVIPTEIVNTIKREIIKHIFFLNFHSTIEEW
jgi:hypothetical protein